MGAGKPADDRTKPELVDKDHSTWTWKNLSKRENRSKEFPEGDIVALAALQTNAGVLLFLECLW